MNKCARNITKKSVKIEVPEQPEDAD